MTTAMCLPLITGESLVVYLRCSDGPRKFRTFHHRGHGGTRRKSHGQCAVFRKVCSMYSRHATAQVWVPCPCVFSLMGRSTNVPFFSRLLSRSAMPSSGGLMKSSAELIHITGALIVSSRDDGS